MLVFIPLSFFLSLLFASIFLPSLIASLRRCSRLPSSFIFSPLLSLWCFYFLLLRKKINKKNYQIRHQSLIIEMRMRLIFPSWCFSSTELLKTGLSFYHTIFLIMIFYTLALCFLLLTLLRTDVVELQKQTSRSPSL